MARTVRRRRARENPLKTRDKFLIGGGLAVALGVITFFATRPSKAATVGGSTANGKGASDQGGYTSGPAEKLLAEQAAQRAREELANLAKSSSSAFWGGADYKQPPLLDENGNVIKG